jgi:predicted DNA-binding protein (UPF0251 family)
MTDSEKLDVALAKLERMERIVPLVEQLLTEQPSVSEQAKKAGVSRSTIWRRKKAARLKALAAGRI